MSEDSALRPTVLLVEDNDTIRGAFAILLEESGYSVLQARLGQDALRLVRERLPDLVLMDLGLPDLNGLEVTRRLKSEEETRAVPIVALTGRALETDVEACRAAGCDGYFTKPIDASRLLEALPTFMVGRKSGPHHPSASPAE
jgi:two-component system, cell cycle response regulator DivK